MRSIWKGHIRFSLVTIPIKMYSATESTKSISFRQLHKEDNSPIGYDKKCKKCKESLSSSDIVKAYEYESDKFVIIESEDFDKIKLKSTRVIEIEAFVDRDDVPSTLYDTPYFAGPDGEVALKAFGLLSESLRKSNKLAVGRVVLRDREQVMLIAPEGTGLLLYKLRYPSEIRKIESVPGLEDVTVEADQLKLADTLIETMTKDFNKLSLQDRYRDAVLSMVEAKIAGKEVVSIMEEDEPVVDIMAALKASITQAKDETVGMKKAKPKDKNLDSQKTG